MKPRRSDVITSATAIAVVVAFLLLTLWLTFTEPTGPASFRLGEPTVRVEPAGQSFVIDITNVGGRSAEGVTVRATLPDKSEIDQEVTWLAPGETEDLAFVVASDFVADDVVFEVISYVEAG